MANERITEIGPEVPQERVKAPASLAADAGSSIDRSVRQQHRFFQMSWYATNCLLLASIIAAAYASVWEFSTRRYVKGSSDAIIPASASPEEAIQSILNWMSHGPVQASTFAGSPSDRDPIDTLNYTSLLQVCGTATNAFLNLADSNGLAARRLLLLDSDSRTKHVDAEVLVNGRWIVVDPVFRVILRGPDGKTLTRNQLAIPAVFSAATRDIPRYLPDYSFEYTAHVRLARLGFIGSPIQKALNSVIPGWDESVTLSLVLERESLAVATGMIVIVLILSFLRFSLRWYGEKHLRVHPYHIRHQLRRAVEAFFNAAG